MNIKGLMPGEMVMRHKSLYALDRERDVNLDWAFAECAKAQRVYDLAKAFLEGDSDVLAKAASDDIELAKADVAALRATYGASAASGSWPMTSWARSRPAYGPIVSPDGPRPLPTISRPSNPCMIPSIGLIAGPIGRKPIRVSIRVAAARPGAIVRASFSTSA